MKKTFYVQLAGLLTLCLLPLSSPTFAAELKLGFVDAPKIFEEAPQAEASRSKLEKEFAPRDKDLVASQKKLKTLEDKLNQSDSDVSDADRRRSERDIISQKRDLKRAQDELREDFNIRRNEEFGRLQKLVYDAIVELAKQEGYDLIIGEGAIFASDRVDITARVLARLKGGKSESSAPSKE